MIFVIGRVNVFALIEVRVAAKINPLTVFLLLFHHEFNHTTVMSHVQYY